MREHLTSLVSCPAAFVYVKSETTLNDVKQPNVEYYVWKRFDKLLMSWLLASIYEDMFSHVASCHTSAKVWDTSEHYFVTKSKVRIVHLRNTLQNFKKENISIQEYIRRIKEMYDTLVTCGQRIIEEELINFVIDGLGPEFEPVIAIIMTNLDSSGGKV